MMSNDDVSIMYGGNDGEGESTWAKLYWVSNRQKYYSTGGSSANKLQLKNTGSANAIADKRCSFELRG